MAVKKSKEKQWFVIMAPKIFDGKEIGKTLTVEPENLLNRTIYVNAIDLRNDLSKYYLKFRFRIVKLEGSKALTEFDGFECMQDYISRMVLRRVRRIDTIQDLNTKDGVKLRVKGLTTISKKATSTVEKSVRVLISKLIKEETEKTPLSEFINMMMSGELKTKILKQGRKIYPVRNFEIRKIEVIS